MKALSLLPHLFFGLAILVTAEAQQPFPGLSAQTALETLSARYGQAASSWVAEMQATDGQPQPGHWEVLVHNDRSPGTLHRYLVTSGMVQDGGPETRRYPSDEPKGFFTIGDVGVDSVAAFTIAETEARKAKVGFDSCDYFLTTREFSRETVWKLELIDASKRMVGKIYISGSNGQVLRTIWVVQDAISGFTRIVDSATPNGMASAGPPQQISSFPNNNTPMVVPQGPANAPGTGIAQVPSPYTPVNPDGSVSRNPAFGVPNNNMGQTVPTQPRTGSIFKDFSTQGGGGTATNPMPIPSVTTNPVSPNPPISQNTPVDPLMDDIPEPEPIPIPSPEPVRTPTTPTAPPINVPSNGGGSSERIPPPPVPGI